jgi:hypothetical protein
MMAGLQLTYGGTNYGGTITGGIQQNVGGIMSLGTMNGTGTIVETMRSTGWNTWFPASGGVQITGSNGLTLQTQGSVFIPGTAASGTGYISSTTSSNLATAFGSSNFTIEFWVYPTASTTLNYLTWFSTGTATAGQEIRIGQSTIASNTMGFGVPNAGSTAGSFIQATAAGGGTVLPTLNTWSHVALVRNGDVITMYYGGVSNASTTSAFTFSNTGPIYLGRNPNVGDGYYTGFIGGLRIINGTALYTTNFTPPTSAFTFISGTSLLMNMFSSATALTDSANATGFALVNSAVWSAFSPMGGVTLATLGAGATVIQTTNIYGTSAANVIPALNIRATSGSYLALTGPPGIFSGFQTDPSGGLQINAVGANGIAFYTSNQPLIFCNTSSSTTALTISGGGNLSNSNATSNSIGGSTLSNSILTVGAATAGSTTSGSVNVSGGYFVNGVAFTGGGGGGTISGTYTSGTVLLATGTTTGLQGSANMSFSGTLLDVNGGAVIRNGFRPSYSLVSSGTSITVAANTYGYHYNITTSGITGITLPTGITSTDSNAYWVFRNNTSGYLSITFTYQTAGTTPTNPVAIPPANSITMMVTYPSSSLVYVLF